MPRNSPLAAENQSRRGISARPSVWSNNELKAGPVTLLLDGDRLIVSTGGYLFCLDPLTGKVLWNNEMKGYGPLAPTALASMRGQSQPLAAQHAAAAAETTTTVIAAGVGGAVIASTSGA